MIDNIKIAVFQYDIEWLNVQENLNKIEQYCQKLEEKVDIVFLPEMFASGFTVSPAELSTENQQVCIDRLSELSEKFQIAFSGSIPFLDGQQYYNRLLFVSPDKEFEFYNKRHLFSIGEENLNYQYGNERKIFEYKGWRLMPQVCYDLRFPVWSRNDLDYDILYYSSNWPSVRNYAWESLLKARAIENQCYVIGINRIGKDGRGLNYIGNSQIISVNGEILKHGGTEEKLLVMNLDRELLDRYRKSFPILNDRDTFEIKK